MSKIPIAVNREFISGLAPNSRGKVRDTYLLENDGLLLPVATDRVSIFDHVLPAEVRQKGEVLTVLNIFWALRLGDHAPQDVVAYGEYIDDFLPESRRGDAELQKRATVVRKLDMIPAEAIIRGYLTGSGYAEYARTKPNHKVCGHSLPRGLKDGDRLPAPIFTPTTKATDGHDENIPIELFRQRFGELGNRIERLSLELFSVASEIALARGIIIADTKLEFGTDPKTGDLVLGDERFTPDSSRFWNLSGWRQSRDTGTSPMPFDKQFVREWGKTVGVNKLDPLRSEDVEQIHGLTVPRDILARTAHLYRYIPYLITGMRIEAFQQSQMGIQTSLPPVEIILGSESDFPHIERGLDTLRKRKVRFTVHVISCHRNPETLRQYAESMVPENATVIAAAGKAAALPGVLQAWLRHYGKGYIPVLGVALSGSGDVDLVAAKLSIERLPGTPVILKTGDEAYSGAEGFIEACNDAITKEFFVPEGSPKEAKFNLVGA